QSALAEKKRRQPIEIAAQRRVGNVRPFLAFRAAKKRHAVAPLVQGPVPRQAFDSDILNPAGQDLCGFLVGSNGNRLLAQRKRAKTAAAPAAQRRARLVEINFCAAFDAIGKTAFDLRKRKRRREQDATLPRLPRQFGHHEERLTCERRRFIDRRAASVRQQKSIRPRAAVLGKTVGIGEREEGARFSLSAVVFFTSPLAGEVGARSVPGGGSSCSAVILGIPPSPALPLKGGGSALRQQQVLGFPNRRPPLLHP